MKVCTVVLLLISLSAGRQLITINDIETLFTKFILKQLTKEEYVTFQQVLDTLYRPEPISTLPLEDSGEFRLTIDCILCRSAGFAIIEAIRQGQTDDEIVESVTVLCAGLGVSTYNVCHGAIKENIHIITYIIKTTPEVSAQTFCGLILQTDTKPNACPYTDPRFEWKVNIPEIVNGDTVPAALQSSVNDRKPLKVVIITDAHIDPLYNPFGVADCDEPVCCRKGQNHAKRFVYKPKIDEALLKENFFEINGDIIINLGALYELVQINYKSRKYVNIRISEPAGFWGDYRNCDTPKWAFDDVIDNIKENHDIDLVYYIGDTIDHGVWETSYELVNDSNRHLIEKIRSTFGENVVVVPTVGNHESHPTNQFAPSSITAPKLNTTWLYKALAEKWSSFLSDDAKASLVQRGAFSVLVRPGTRVISINNNIAYKFNWWLLYDPLDSKKQLEWLIEELYKAESQGEKVHILAHIPPGTHDLTHTWTREYNRVINRFSSTIAAEFNGHTHLDQFQIFYSPDNKPINMAWNAGSITSYRFYNLNYKIVTFNAQTLMPDNIVNYVYNLTEANLTPHRRPHWFLLYDLKNSFELSDLSPSSMNNLVNSMVTEKPNLLALYSAFTSKLSDPVWKQCDDECKIKNLCKTVVTVLWERQKCDELREQFYSKT